MSVIFFHFCFILFFCFYFAEVNTEQCGIYVTMAFWLTVQRTAKCNILYCAPAGWPGLAHLFAVAHNVSVHGMHGGWPIRYVIIQFFLFFAILVLNKAPYGNHVEGPELHSSINTHAHSHADVYTPIECCYVALC